MASSKRIQIKVFVYLAVLLLIPAFAYAHIIGGNGLSDGLIHPLSGIDHLLAMLAVGIIGVQLGKRAVWFVPLCFVAMMIFGGIAGILGVKVVGTELAIALSVIILGMGIAFVKKLPIKYSVPLSLMSVALAAFFHGHAHGEEMPVVAGPLLYGVGFVLATAALHITGVGIGYHGSRTGVRSKLLRFAGIAVSVVGVFFLVSV